MDVLSLLRRHEGKTLEFKRDLSSPGGVLRTLVAFANSSGGVLLIGEVFPISQRPHWVRADGMPKGAHVRIGSTNRCPDASLLAELKREAANEVFYETPLPDVNSEALDFRAASELFRPRRAIKPAERQSQRERTSAADPAVFGRAEEMW
jgi:ATP-dependent DNA helicase RecG